MFCSLQGFKSSVLGQQATTLPARAPFCVFGPGTGKRFLLLGSLEPLAVGVRLQGSTFRGFAARQAEVQLLSAISKAATKQRKLSTPKSQTRALVSESWGRHPGPALLSAAQPKGDNDSSVRRAVFLPRLRNTTGEWTEKVLT